jgi:hypothetical protein
MWVKDAKLDCEIGKIKTAEDVASIIAYCEKKKYIAFKQVKNADGTVTLTAEADPFAQVGDMLQAPPAYRVALAAMDEDFVANVLKQIKMDKKATVKFTSHIAKGDAKTEMEIRVK